MFELILAAGIIVFLAMPVGLLAILAAASILKDEFGIDILKRFRKKEDE